MLHDYLLAALERFSSWPNRVFAAIWNAISAFKRFFLSRPKPQALSKPHFEALAVIVVYMSFRKPEPVLHSSNFFLQEHLSIKSVNICGRFSVSICFPFFVEGRGVLHFPFYQRVELGPMRGRALPS